MHLPPDQEQSHPTDPLKTLCGVLGADTDPMDAEATCPACLALAQRPDNLQHKPADRMPETPTHGEREINEPAALQTSPGGDRCDRRPRVEVETGRPGGKKTRASAMVATGAEASFVRTEVADTLGLLRRPGLKWRVRGDTAAKRTDVAQATLGLTDGSAVTESMELGCVDHLPAGCDLEIGRDALAKLTFRYDGTSGAATLEAS